MQRANSLEKTLMLGKIEGRKEKGTMEGKMFGCENWILKKAEHQRIDASELWC